MVEIMLCQLSFRYELATIHSTHQIINKFRYIKIQHNKHNRPLHEALVNKSHKLCSFSQDPRSEVYCFRLNFNISKLVYWDLLSNTFGPEIVLNTVVLFKGVRRMKPDLVCDRSNENYWAVPSCGTVYFGLQGCCNSYIWGTNPGVWIQIKAID